MPSLLVRTAVSQLRTIFNVDKFLFLEGVYIAGNVQVELIGLDFFKGSHMSEPLHIHPISIGTEDIVDMALIQLVLVLVLAVSQLAFRILARSIDEEDIVGGTVFLKHQNTCRDRCAIEQIGGQTDNSIQQILLNDSLADTAFCRTSKQNTMRNNSSHATITTQRVWFLN